MNECVQQHIPVVGINRQPTIPGVDYVCSDNVAGAELAADQLLRSGCRRFGWLNHSPSTWAGRMRGEAFSRALQARGVDVERNLAILACPEEAIRAGFRPLRSPTRRWRGSSALTPRLPAAFSMECASAANRRLRIIS
ncbi:LacI family transcriptional regulator [Klebsiella aerogenes]|nr:LacI family transcriptional regulator [Klebsiella aerogenes]